MPMILLLLLLADLTAVKKLQDIPSDWKDLDSTKDVYELLIFLMKFKTSHLEEVEANRFRSFKAALKIREHFGPYREPPTSFSSNEEDSKKISSDQILDSSNPPCDNFELDLTHARFNMCRHCGRALLDHAQHRASSSQKKKEKFVAPKKTLVRDSTSWLKRATQRKGHEKLNQDPIRKVFNPKFKSLLAIVIEHAREDAKRDGQKKKRKEKIIRSWKDLKQLRIREPVGLMPEDQSSQSVIDFTIWINSIFETSPLAYTLKGWRMLCKKLEPLAGLGRLFRKKDWIKIRSMLKTNPSLYVLIHFHNNNTHSHFAFKKTKQKKVQRGPRRRGRDFDPSCSSKRCTLRYYHVTPEKSPSMYLQD